MPTSFHNKLHFSLFYICSLLFITAICYGQRHDNHWVAGYNVFSNPTDTIVGTMFINFDGDSFQVNYPSFDTIDIDMHINSITMSDQLGNLMFYSDGIDVRDARHSILLGSENYNAHPFHEQYEDFGLPNLQGTLPLPKPGSVKEYYLIHNKFNLEVEPNLRIYSPDIYCSTIDMSRNHGYGEMIEVDRPLLGDTLENFAITGVKHANGRDWWVVAGADDDLDSLYLFLVDTVGPKLYSRLHVPTGQGKEYGIGQAQFSPDGKYYLRSRSVNFGEPVYLDIYRFDRCAGFFTYLRTISFGDGESQAAGLAVSHDSRFVYANNGIRMMQFDLKADDIEASMMEVGRYDGYKTPNNFPTVFFTSWLAPDGLIYTACTNGVKPTHVVNKPWLKGEDCDFIQRAIWLPRANGQSIPNHVNYRLGPVDGSICDTLGIDNVPLSRWRSDAVYHTVAFRDLSAYEPATWSWTFGDGGMSTDTSPVHTYASSGDYEVCLTVSNIYGSDELCKIIRIRDSLSSVEAIERHTQFMLYPNPVRDALYIRSSDPLGMVDYILRDMHGALIRQGQIALHDGQTASLNMADLPPGMYLLELYKEGWRLSSERVARMR